MTKTKVEFSKMNVNILRVCNHIYFRFKGLLYSIFYEAKVNKREANEPWKIELCLHFTGG